MVDDRLETKRTPWSAAGRNKPAKLCVEQTVEVGKNDKNGTAFEVGTSGPTSVGRRDTQGDVDGGESLKTP